MIAAVAAKAAEVIKEVAASAEEINTVSAVNEAKDIASEIWPDTQENIMPKSIESSPEALADEAWEQCASVEEIDGKGTWENPRYISTKNESLAGDVHPITGVEFVKKMVQLEDEVIEGVFPKFESAFEAKLPDNMLLETDKNQFRECNRQLAASLEENPDLKANFTTEQIEQIYDGIKDGSAPDGYVWHHNEEVGRMQLVDAETHARTGHTGGKFLWGGNR